MNTDSINRILKLLCELTILAHKELIETEEDFEYFPDQHIWEGAVTFNDDLFLEYAGMSVTPSGGTYWLELNAIGPLKEILSSASLPTEFYTLLINEKFYPSVYLDHETNLDKVFHSSQFHENFDMKKINESKIKEVILDIEMIVFEKKLKYG